MRILAITPCRKGSTGVQNKNIRELCGYPLLWYTINAVKLCSFPIRHIVSTNDPIIMEYAKNLTEVLIHSDKLSENGKSSFGVVRYVIQLLKSQEYLPDIIMLLRATSPLRISKDIDESLNLFLTKEKDGYDSVIAYTELISPHPKRMRVFDSKNLINIYNEEEHQLRQDLKPKLLLRNEAIYIVRPELILSGSLWGKRPFPYIMPTIRSVNINDELDFLLAEAIIKKL